MKVAVLGCGNGGHQIAADLTLAGFKVNLFEMPKFRDNIKRLLETGEIWTSGGIRTGVARVNMISTDIEKVINGVKYVFIIVPAFAHEAYARLLAPYLRGEHVVILMPGTFGSLEFINTLEKEGGTGNITIAESDTFPWACRLVEPAKVDVYITARRLGLGVLPSSRTETVMEFMKKIFPVFHYPDVLACGLSSVNPSIHPIGILMNTGRIEYSDNNFFLYQEGYSQTVAKVAEEMDYERLSVGKAWEYSLTPLVKDIYGWGLGYGSNGTLGQAIRNSRLISIEGVSSRYITEDVPYGLVPWVGLADLAGVSIPIMKSIIQIASSMHGINYFKEGRTLKKLGLSKLRIDEIKKLVSK
jgi:opine dehydrogenase